MRLFVRDNQPQDNVALRDSEHWCFALASVKATVGLWRGDDAAHTLEPHRRYCIIEGEMTHRVQYIFLCRWETPSSPLTPN